MQVDDGWEVWVSNGGTEPFFEGVPLAVCQGQLEAELVMEGLRLLKARPSAEGQRDA